MATVTKHNDISRLMLTTVVDKLGKLKSMLADMREEEKALKQRLIDSGYDEIEGDLFRVVVSKTNTSRVDYKSLVDHLEVPSKVVESFTTRSPSTRVLVNSHKSVSK